MKRRDFIKGISSLILYNLIPFNKLYSTEKSEKNKFILTFDDVPYELDKTKSLVNLLKNYNFKNSQFYLTGKGIKEYESSVEYLIQNNFSVGWHSMNHEIMRNKKDSDFLKDIKDWKKLLKSINYFYEPTLARFPYGKGSNNQINILKNEGLLVYPCSSRGIHPTNWDIDSYDWNEEKVMNPKEFSKLNYNSENKELIILFHQQLAKPVLTKDKRIIKESLLTSNLEVFKEVLENINYNNKVNYFNKS